MNLTDTIENFKKTLPAGVDFKTTAKFFEEIQIGRKRWGQLVRGEKSPTLDELTRIADYFNTSLTDLINS